VEQVHQQLLFGDEMELGLLQLEVEDEVDEQYYHEV